MTTSGFISYAHDDHDDFMTFRSHIRATERAFGISFWHDKRMSPGSYWNDRIAAAIANANIHLMLFSPAFLDSDYIYDHEVPAINAKAEAGDLVIPVILKPCSWNWLAGVLQAVPMDPKGKLRPVLKWNPKSDGFHAAQQQLDQALKDHLGRGPASPFGWGRP